MMKLTSFVFFFLLSVGLVFAQGEARQKAMERTAEKEMAVTGEVVDISCYLQGGAKGEDHRTCAIGCAKAGGALGILTADGKLYVSVLPDDHEAGPNALLIDHAARIVTAKGIVRSKGGVNGIMIKSVAKAKTEKAREN